MPKAKQSDHVPGNPLANYLMKESFEHVLNSGAGPSVDTITTGMKKPLIPGGNEKLGAWEIHACTIRPMSSQAGNPLPYAAASCWCLFSLQYGPSDDILHEDDEDYDDLIAGGAFHLDLASSGANSHFWPMALDIVNPRPVFAEEIYFASESPNVVPVNSAAFTVTLWYAPIILTANQVDIMLAMRARL